MRSKSIRSPSGSASGSKSLCAIPSIRAVSRRPPRYVLSTSLISVLGNLGIQSEGLATLGQIDTFATFMLVDLQNNATLLTNTVHVANSFDLNPNQYSTIVGEDDARVRSVAELDQEIVARLTMFMQRRIAEKGSKPG